MLRQRQEAGGKETNAGSFLHARLVLWALHRRPAGQPAPWLPCPSPRHEQQGSKGLPAAHQPEARPAVYGGCGGALRLAERLEEARDAFRPASRRARQAEAVTIDRERDNTSVACPCRCAGLRRRAWNFGRGATKRRGGSRWARRVCARHPAAVVLHRHPQQARIRVVFGDHRHEAGALLHELDRVAHLRLKRVARGQKKLVSAAYRQTQPTARGVRAAG